LEAPAVGEALAQLIAKIAQSVEQWHLPSVNALVVGCGSIGEKLTEALLSRRFKVTAYDRDPMKRRKAKELRHGPELIDDLDDLSPFRIVIGTTGETSLGVTALLSLSHNVILASGSSDRLEIDMDALIGLVRDSNRDIWMRDDFTIFRLMKENREIRLLCDGYPINFIIGEGISKAVIDPILAELIAGVVCLFTPNANSKKGIIMLPQSTEEEIDKLFQKYHQGS
jgi:S-adenosylhomocysteine hydrolase